MLLEGVPMSIISYLLNELDEDCWAVDEFGMNSARMRLTKLWFLNIQMRLLPCILGMEEEINTRIYRRTPATNRNYNPLSELCLDIRVVCKPRSIEIGC